MQLILDNLIAIMVSASLAILLLTQQTSSSQDAIERQSVYGAKVQSLALAEWLERDIVKLGARFGEDRERFTVATPTETNGAPFTDQFEFEYNEAENGGTADRVRVRYTLVPTDSVLVALKTPTSAARYVQLYRLDRSEGAGVWRNPKKDPATGTQTKGTWLDSAGQPTDDKPALVADPTHRSPYGLSYFYIEPRTSSGTPVLEQSRASEADYVHVQFSVLPTLFPVYRARYIRETGLTWASTFEIRPF